MAGALAVKYYQDLWSIFYDIVHAYMIIVSDYLNHGSDHRPGCPSVLRVVNFHTWTPEDCVINKHQQRFLATALTVGKKVVLRKWNVRILRHRKNGGMCLKHYIP